LPVKKSVIRFSDWTLSFSYCYELMASTTSNSRIAHFRNSLFRSCFLPLSLLLLLFVSYLTKLCSDCIYFIYYAYILLNISAAYVYLLLLIMRTPTKNSISTASLLFPSFFSMNVSFINSVILVIAGI